jgi:hypothetical protein
MYHSGKCGHKLQRNFNIKRDEFGGLRMESPVAFIPSFVQNRFTSVWIIPASIRTAYFQNTFRVFAVSFGVKSGTFVQFVPFI